MKGGEEDAREITRCRGQRAWDADRRDRADMHHDGFQAQVFSPPPRRGILPLRRARTELGCPSDPREFSRLATCQGRYKEVGGKTTTAPSEVGASGAELTT